MLINNTSHANVSTDTIIRKGPGRTVRSVRVSLQSLSRLGPQCGGRVHWLRRQPMATRGGILRHWMPSSQRKKRWGKQLAKQSTNATLLPPFDLHKLALRVRPHRSVRAHQWAVSDYHSLVLQQSLKCASRMSRDKLSTK